MGYKIIVFLINCFMRLIFRISVEGKENVPMEGSAIIAVNHRSNWDPVLIGMSCPRKLRYMAKAELFKPKLVGALLKSLGAFPIHRGTGDVGAIKGALAILRSEHPMLIFPEGKRVRDGKEVQAKPGAVMLAIKTKTPIVPVCISGGYRFWSKIVIHYGEPVEYSAYYGEKVVVETLQILSNDLMKTIRSYRVDLGRRTKA